jgi:hypothetical protein
VFGGELATFTVAGIVSVPLDDYRFGIVILVTIGEEITAAILGFSQTLLSGL